MPKIDNAFFGSVLVDGKKFETDLTVCWDGEIHERKRTHVFDKNEFNDIMLKEPEIVIIGTGNSGLLQIDPSVVAAASLHGIELVAAKTPEAAQKFNSAARMRKRVVAVLHATC